MSRYRRTSEMLNTLLSLSMPPERACPDWISMRSSAGLEGSLAADDSADGSVPPTAFGPLRDDCSSSCGRSPSPSSADRRSSKATCTSRASDAVRVFFAGKAERAHSVAASAEPRPAISCASRPRKAAEFSLSRIGRGPSLPFSCGRGWLWEAATGATANSRQSAASQCPNRPSVCDSSRTRRHARAARRQRAAASAMMELVRRDRDRIAHLAGIGLALR